MPSRFRTDCCPRCIVESSVFDVANAAHGYWDKRDSDSWFRLGPISARRVLKSLAICGPQYAASQIKRECVQRS